MLKGMLVVILTMSGERDRTKYKYEIDIENSIFDIIELGNVKSVGSYDGEFLHIDNVKQTPKVIVLLV